MAEDDLDAQGLRRLLDVGRSLVSELDLDVVLDRVLEVAGELTGARYAALGILDDRRRELDRCLTRGIDETTRRTIGGLPRGHGISASSSTTRVRCVSRMSATTPLETTSSIARRDPPGGFGRRTRDDDRGVVARAPSQPSPGTLAPRGLTRPRPVFPA